MPALVKRRLGESGRSDDDGTMVCFFSRKKSRNDCLIWAEVMTPELSATFYRMRELLRFNFEQPRRRDCLNARFAPRRFPRGWVLASAPRIRDGHYCRTYSQRGRANGNRGVDRDRARRKRLWEKEGLASSQMPHGPSYPSRAIC